MTVKPGVRVQGLRPEALFGMWLVEEVYAANGERLVITSLTEGTHMATSLHYKGFAFDCRLPQEAVVEDVVKAIKAILGVEFDVVLESTHIHVEFDPKT